MYRSPLLSIAILLIPFFSSAQTRLNVVLLAPPGLSIEIPIGAKHGIEASGGGWTRKYDTPMFDHEVTEHKSRTMFTLAGKRYLTERNPNESSMLVSFGLYLCYRSIVYKTPDYEALSQHLQSHIANAPRTPRLIEHGAKYSAGMLMETKFYLDPNIYLSMTLGFDLCPYTLYYVDREYYLDDEVERENLGYRWNGLEDNQYFWSHLSGLFNMGLTFNLSGKEGE